MVFTFQESVMSGLLKAFSSLVLIGHLHAFALGMTASCRAWLAWPKALKFTTAASWRKFKIQAEPDTWVAG